ncbi:MAG: hypothetical protein ACLR6A_10660 [Candidatus Gastranaerophilaceae bacterium]
MEDKNFKQQKAKFNFVIIYILGFVISAFFEFYWISYYPYDYFMLAGIGIILCILGYLSIDGILNIIHSAEQKRDEQAETLIKAGKAIYLTTKRMALEQSHTLPEVSDVPKDLNSLVNDLAKANERLSKEVEHAISIQPLLQENQKLVNSVQNTLNTESSAAMEEPVVEDIPVDPEPAMAEDSPVVDDIPEVAVDAPAMEEPVVEDIPVDSEPAVVEDSPVVDDIPEAAVDTPAMEEAAAEDIPVDSEPITDEEPPIPEAVQDALAAQNLPNEEQILSSEPTPKTMTQDEIAAMFADL